METMARFRRSLDTVDTVAPARRAAAALQVEARQEPLRAYQTAKIGKIAKIAKIARFDAAATHKVRRAPLCYMRRAAGDVVPAGSAPGVPRAMKASRAFSILLA